MKTILLTLFLLCSIGVMGQTGTIKGSSTKGITTAELKPGWDNSLYISNGNNMMYTPKEHFFIIQSEPKMLMKVSHTDRTAPEHTKSGLIVNRLDK